MLQVDERRDWQSREGVPEQIVAPVGQPPEARPVLSEFGMTSPKTTRPMSCLSLPLPLSYGNRAMKRSGCMTHRTLVSAVGAAVHHLREAVLFLAWTRRRYSIVLRRLAAVASGPFSFQPL